MKCEQNSHFAPPAHEPRALKTRVEKVISTREPEYVLVRIGWLAGVEVAVKDGSNRNSNEGKKESGRAISAIESHSLLFSTLIWKTMTM